MESPKKLNPAPFKDVSNGWEDVAAEFITAREKSFIGLAVTQAWAKNLPDGAAILDLGCGTGIPISQSLIQNGFKVYGVDASPTLIAEFRRRFPHMDSACEPVETSTFFGKRFGGVAAIGLMFLLPPQEQHTLISKVAAVLNPGGHFLFTAPNQACKWNDALTGRESRSLGTDAYLTAFTEVGLTLVNNYTDEGDNYYFHAQMQN